MALKVVEVLDVYVAGVMVRLGKFDVAVLQGENTRMDTKHFLQHDDPRPLTVEVVAERCFYCLLHPATPEIAARILSLHGYCWDQRDGYHGFWMRVEKSVKEVREDLLKL